MLHLSYTQLNKIEAGIVRGTKYYLSKFIRNIFKDQIQCPELRNILKLFPAKFFLMRKIIDLRDTWVEFCIIIIDEQNILLKYQWICKPDQMGPV